MHHYVYVLLNPTIVGTWEYKNHTLNNQPFYVGIGVGGRWKDHLNLNREKYESNFTKFNLVKKLTENKTPPIIIKLYEKLDKEIAKKIEIDLIKFFGKIINNSGILTNITDGGDQTNCNKLGDNNIHSKKVFQYSINGDFIKEWGALREIGRVLNISYNTIGDCCRGNTKTAHGFQWFYTFNGNSISTVKIREQFKTKKIVYVYDNAGNNIKKFESLVTAANFYNVTKSFLSNIINNNNFFNEEFFSYSGNFKPTKKYKSRFHKIKHDNKIYLLSNKKIMETFNVSKYYIFLIKGNKIKNPKFTIQD